MARYVSWLIRLHTIHVERVVTLEIESGEDEQLGILLRVEDGGDRNSEVGDGTPEIYRFVNACFCCSSGFRSVG